MILTSDATLPFRRLVALRYIIDEKLLSTSINTLKFESSFNTFILFKQQNETKDDELISSYYVMIINNFSFSLSFHIQT